MAHKFLQGWALIYSCNDELQVWVCPTEGECRHQLYHVVSQLWGEAMNDVEELPLDKDLAVQLYFDSTSCEWWKIVRAR